MLKPWLLVFLVVAQTAAQCPDTYTALPDNQRCIKAFPDKKNYSDAEQICRKEGGFLGAIHNAFDNTAFYAAVQKVLSGTTSAWIGLHREDDGKFAWDDGSALDYENWRPGFPLYDFDWPACVSMSMDTANSPKKWANEEECGTQNYYVCEVVAGAINKCPFEQFNSTEQDQELSTEGYSKPISRYNCIKDIVAPESYNVYLKINKVYASGNAFVRISDADTGDVIVTYQNTNVDQYYNSNARHVSIHAFADNTSSVSYRMFYSSEPTTCEFTHYPCESTEHRIQTFAYDRVLSNYNCSVLIYARAGYNVYTRAEYLYASGDAFVKFTDADTGKVLKIYEKLSSWVSAAQNTNAQKVVVQAYAGRTGFVYYRLFYSSEPTTCPFESFPSTNNEQTLMTWSYDRWLTNYNCTKEIYADEGDNVYIDSSLLAVYGNAFIKFIDADSGEVIKTYEEYRSNPSFNTNVRRVLIQAYASPEGGVAYNLYYSSEPTTCPFEIYHSTNSEQALMTWSYDRWLTNYNCTKEIYADEGDNVYIDSSLLAVYGKAFIKIIDADSGAVIRTYEEYRSNPSFNTNVRRVLVSVYATSEGGVAYKLYYSSEPTSCSFESYHAVYNEQTLMTWSYDRWLTNYNCTKEIYADEGYSVYIDSSLLADYGNAFIKFTDADSGKVIANYENYRSNPSFNTKVRRVLVQAYATSEGGVAYKLYYSSVAVKTGLKNASRTTKPGKELTAESNATDFGLLGSI